MEKNLKIDDYDKILRWSYNVARKWVQENIVPLQVTSARKFEAYKKAGKYLPKHFPRKPNEYFKRKDTWKGWQDFLGYPKQNITTVFVNYGEAAQIAKMAGIKNSGDYKRWKRPSNMPARPEYRYKEWKGWPEFLQEKYEKPIVKGYRKLKVSDVRIIKHQLEIGVPGTLLAKTFGVSEMQISRIKHGENWNDI